MSVLACNGCGVIKIFFLTLRVGHAIEHLCACFPQCCSYEKKNLLITLRLESKEPNYLQVGGRHVSPNYNVAVIKEGQRMSRQMSSKTLHLLTSVTSFLWNGRDKSSHPS